MTSIFKFVQVLFYIFMALFLIGGLGIVVIQTFGILSASGETVTGVNDWLSPWVFSCATACAVCAFVLNYSKDTVKPAEEE